MINLKKNNYKIVLGFLVIWLAISLLDKNSIESLDQYRYNYGVVNFFMVILYSTIGQIATIVVLMLIGLMLIFFSLLKNKKD